MSDIITPEISDRICKHMNEDHAEAIVLYAKVFGNSPNAESAKMLAIDPQGMNLMAQVAGADTPIRIEFDRTLQDSEDAHQTLITMVKQARQSVVSS
jgi:putative heme iron utilization protein